MFLRQKNIVISENYTIKTSNSRQEVLKMVSEYSPAGIIGLGLVTSIMFLEVVLRDRSDDFVEVLPGFKLKWTQALANNEVGVPIIVKEAL